MRGENAEIRKIQGDYFRLLIIVSAGMYTYGCFMTKQERKFTLGEVNTRMGTMGEVTFDQMLLDVLGIKPGDFLVFTISTDGVVTVTGEKKAALTKPAATPARL